MCDNCHKITLAIQITLRNHERSYAEWFRYIEDRSGPDELVLYSLSRKFGIHTVVYNKSYVWTTLSEHIHRTDDEIFSLCGVNLVYLGETTYGIIRKIRAPQIPIPNQTPTKRSSALQPTNKSGKQTCQSNDIASKRGVSKRGRGRGRGRGKSAHTLSESRKVNYGISSQQATTCSTGRIHAPIDYLALNDGLEEDTPSSPKKKWHVMHHPKGVLSLLELQPKSP